MTTNTEHTPAPWQTGDELRHIYYLDIDYEEGRVEDGKEHPSHDSVIARLPDDYAGGCSSAEIDANCRLIAAAPDLLAALKALLAYHNLTLSAVPADQRLLDAGYAAIAKAEGES
jgi:hypothetical protein